MVRLGKLCIEVAPNSKLAYISEELCIGCGICVKKCPFEAVRIINIPKNLEKETTHRYGPNSFKLHRLPMPRPGQVLGLVGTHGIGKSTALKVLAGKLKPNLGRFEGAPDWQEILTYFRGSELQNYFTKVWPACPGRAQTPCARHAMCDAPCAMCHVPRVPCAMCPV